MILKASQRSGPRSLAAHLLNVNDNEHIEVFDVRGLVAEDLAAALIQMDALAQGTKARKPLFSVSLNPPAHEDATLEQFEDALSRIEKQFGFENQARALVIHLKNGRRHVHAVYSMIDQDRKKALEVKFYKNRLMEISRELYREHKWEIPKGLQQDRQEAKRKGKKIDRGMEDNYTLAEKHQADRAGRDPKQYKQMVQDLYERADTRATFEASLAEKGLFLARGERPYCIVDATGQVQALARLTGRKQKELKERLGDHLTLPTVEQVHEVIKQRALDARFKRAMSELKARHAKERNLYRMKDSQLWEQHRKQNQTLKRQHGRRMVEEERAFAKRLQGGIIRKFEKFVGWVTGDETRTQKRIGLEREQNRRRDLRERDDLHKKQRLEREHWKWGFRELERNQQKEIDNLREAIVQDIEREGGTIREEARERSRKRDRGEERQHEERENALAKTFKEADRDHSEDKGAEHETERDTDIGRETPDRADDRGPKLER